MANFDGGWGINWEEYNTKMDYTTIFYKAGSLATQAAQLAGTLGTDVAMDLLEVAAELSEAGKVEARYRETYIDVLYGDLLNLERVAARLGLDWFAEEVAVFCSKYF